jgi:hypothetical protein
MMQEQNYKDHYLRWIKIYQKAKEDKFFSDSLVSLCEKDVVYFINNFIYTYDPRTEDKTLPMILYPFQEDFINKLEENYRAKKSLLVEKSRDMGFSWVILAWLVHHFLFDRGFSAGLASRKQHLVDDLGNMGSLMQRMRFMLNKLPSFLRKDWDEKKCSKLMMITLDSMGTQITGESGDEIGRGDRKSVYILDEFAFIPRSSVVHAAVSQTSQMLVFGSTPNGKGNEFARLRWKTDIDRVTLHWSKHPKKNQEWYEAQKKLLDEATIAQELDISYERSTVGRVYRVFDQKRHCKSIVHNRNYPTLLSFDWGIGDPTACVFLQDYGGQVRVFDHFEIKDSSIEQIFNQVFAYLDKHGLTKNDVSGWYGDPDARNRQIVSGMSISSFVKDKYKINLRHKLPNLIRPRIMSVRSLLEQDRLIVDDKLNYLIECFENYRYPNNENSENEKPLHNWASHSMSAIEYYTVFEHGMNQFKKDVPVYSIGWR